MFSFFYVEFDWYVDDCSKGSVGMFEDISLFIRESCASL